MSDLVLRLLSRAEYEDNGGACDRSIEDVGALLLESAALIKTLTAALEPFANVAEHDIGTDETAEDFFVPMREYNRVERLRVGDMRLAKAAFDAAKQEGF